jgi:glycosyltransferase involved in cell wall biosynthesis
MYNLSGGLMEENHKVHILAMNTHKFSVDIDTLPVDYRYKTNFTLVHVDTRIRLRNAFLNLFSKKSFHIERFDSPDFHEALKRILKKNSYDIVQLETIYVAPYIETIRKYSKAKIVLRAHNIEHVIWSRYAGTVTKRNYLSYLTKKLKSYEEQVFSDVDAIAGITDVDTDFIKNYGLNVTVATVPFGLHLSKYILYPEQKKNLTFFHIGSMDWMPNQEAIRWFLDKCMPAVSEQLPDVYVYLAGRNMPSWIYSYKFPNMKVIGEVPDAGEFMLKNSVMFVPLLSGSGVRVKIIEGMALGKTVISTAVGAEGINYTDGENILIANTPDEFLGKFKYCVDQPEQCRQIGLNARKLIESEHDIPVASKRLVDLYQSII